MRRSIHHLLWRKDKRKKTLFLMPLYVKAKAIIYRDSATSIEGWVGMKSAREIFLEYYNLYLSNYDQTNK